MYLDKAKQKFQVLQQLRGEQGVPKPCSNEQVEFLSKELDLTLPAAYIEFMLWAGLGGGCFGGDEFDYERVSSSNKAKAYGLLNHYKQLESFPDDAIIFLFYQGGYAFEFIRASEGDNPPVHQAIETELGLQIRWKFSKTLEEHCLKAIEYLITAYQN